MSPDVSGLGVNSEDASKAGSEGGHRRSMSMQEIIVVLQPVWQDMKRNDPPASLPNLKSSTNLITHYSLNIQLLIKLQLKVCEISLRIKKIHK